MNGFHPKVNRIATCAVATALLAGGGCKSTSSGMNNPFLAPDRVTPPSTRAIAPGQAQPYYQGDPLPVMQSATTPPANNLAASPNLSGGLSSTGKSLGWNAPANGAPAATTAPVAPAQVAANAAQPWGAKPAITAPATYGNEPAVAVPTDGDALRFSLPAPINPEPATPIAAAPTPPSPAQPVTTPPAQSVVPASYNAPAANGSLPATYAPTLSPTAQANSPWQAPQVPATSPSPVYGAQPQYFQPTSPQPPLTTAPAAQVFAAVPTNPVAVQLRAVPSPPPQPGDPVPRIRIPGYEVPQTATADGFRPRSTMR